MSLGWIIAGTFVQMMLAFFLFMVAAFSGGGIANGRKLNKLQMGFLNISLYALPFTCILSAGAAIYRYNQGGDASNYWWYAVPVAATVLYLTYAIYLNNRS